MLRSHSSVAGLWLIPLLAAMAALGGCGARAPAAHVQQPRVAVERPLEDSDDLAAWRRYYAGQFRAYGEDTIEPEATRRVIAREAYRLERQQWAVHQAAVRQRELEEPLYGLFGVIVLGLAGYGVYALLAGD